MDEYARMFIQQDTTTGRMWIGMMGTSEQLVKNKTISAARRYTMPDNVEIDVWVLKSAAEGAPRGTVLALHGLKDSKVAYRRVGQMLADKGFDVVLPDLRAHGRSTGTYTTYGALEKLDQKRVVDELLAEKLISEPLYVFGQDLGASVAIQYAAIEPRVKGVLAIAPSRDVRVACRRFINIMAPLMSERDFEKVLARAGQVAHFDPADASAADAAAKLTCPVILIHGRLDPVVPYTDSESLYQAAGGQKELELVIWAGHMDSPIGFEGKIVEAIEKIADGRVKTTATQPAAQPTSAP